LVCNSNAKQLGTEPVSAEATYVDVKIKQQKVQTYPYLQTALHELQKLAKVPDLIKSDVALGLTDYSSSTHAVKGPYQPLV
jgi:hypothetical protein